MCFVLVCDDDVSCSGFYSSPSAVLVAHAPSVGACDDASCSLVLYTLTHGRFSPQHVLKKGGGESRSMSPVVIEDKWARPSRSAAPLCVPPLSSADIRADASATPTLAHAPMPSGNAIWNPPGYGRIAGNAAKTPDYHEFRSDLGASRREIDGDTVPLFRTPASHTNTAPTWASSPLPYGGDGARQMAAVPVSSVTAGQRSQSFAPITYDTEVWRVTF